MKILVLGAYGFTGNLICKELPKRKLHFSIAGRKLDKLEEIKEKSYYVENIHKLDSSEKSAIDKTIEPYDLIINCIGP
ncbi:MAG: saccharopine dehydrogenase NADP-binding domain-containing protein, partial [Bacteroidales bacterium]|nr:saccharopine dehydrogenase NADP-binding domain-containing protein [Bacteroidales bacterium]